MDLDYLKFPIGQFIKPDVISPQLIEGYISIIKAFPEKLKKEVIHLSEEQLDTPYRPEGWTIRQVVNHCADSHMNSLTRFKLALTEDNPSIKPYFEERWAELADSKLMPIESAIQMLLGIHSRWAFLLQSLDTNDLKRTFFHPESRKQFTLEENIGVYAWHCEHHLAHIVNLKKAKNWV